MRYNQILNDENNANVNFDVLACLKSLRKKEINLKFILKELKICLSSPLTSEDKETLLQAALRHPQLSIEEIEEHFLVPLKMSPENLQAVTSLFLKEVPETYDVNIIIEKIGLLLKHSNPEKISAGIMSSEFLIKLAQWENHKKALEINAYFATHGLVSQMPGSLHEACVANNIPLVKMLIAQGAPVISLREGKTPLDICLESGLVRQKLAGVLVTEYAAGVMQKIPDSLFAMGINSEAELIFLGSQFDKADPKAHFPGAIVSLEDLFLKMKSSRLNIRKPFEPQIQDLEEKIEALKGNGIEIQDLEIEISALKENGLETQDLEKKIGALKKNDLEIQAKRKRHRSKLASILREINRELEIQFTPRLTVIIQRLEECILADQNKELASQLRKRIRFMLPPSIKTEFYGLRHLIVERFGMSIFSTYENTGIPIPDGPLEVYQKLFENDLDIRHSTIRIRKDAQIALLTLRLLKLNEFIAIFEPYGAESIRSFNRRFNNILLPFVALLILAGGIASIVVGASNLPSDPGDSQHLGYKDLFTLGLVITIIMGVLIVIFGGAFLLSGCNANITSFPKNPNKPERLSRLKNIHPNFLNFINFIRSLPTEKFLHSETHQNEIQALMALRKVSLNSSVEDILIHLKRLKNLYESHIKALNAANLSAVDFEYEALIEPEALNQAEPLLSSVVQDPGESSGCEETGDSRLTLIVENNNNGPSLFSKANSSASITSEETAHLLTK